MVKPTEILEFLVDCEDSDVYQPDFESGDTIETEKRKFTVEDVMVSVDTGDVYYYVTQEDVHPQNHWQGTKDAEVLDEKAVN